MSAPDDVLVVLHDLALGGTERVALRLAGAWARAGRRVRVLCGDARGPAGAWLDPAVALAACDPPVARDLGWSRRLGRALAAELATRPARVLFVPGNHHWPLAAAAAALPAELRPAIVAQISNPLRRPDRPPWRRALAVARARRRLAGADALVALSADAAEEARRGLDPHRVETIPLPALDDAAPPPRPPPPGPPEVLCLGRLVRQKRFDLALRAFAAADAPEAVLSFVGEGPRRPALTRLARRLGVADRVSFDGAVSDVRTRLDAARVLLLPSDFEGYGAVVVEALAAGRPVIASDRVPAARELVARPELGVVVPAGDVAGLAHALGERLRAPAATVHAEGLGRFRLGEVAAAYLRLFDSLASPQRG